MLSPVYPGNETAWMLTGPPVYPADLLSRRFRGESIIRLSLGKLLVNLWQVVEQTNTLLITLTVWGLQCSLITIIYFRCLRF